MNIKTLEAVVRTALKSGKIETNTSLTPAEHKSLKSLSWQIAANVNADKTDGTLAMVLPKKLWA